MQDFAPEKPCLVETGRGFSVSYKNRLLYSRHDPKKTVLRAVADAQILPGTLVLALSPCLWYGLEELLSKLDGSSFVLGVETDAQLHELSRTALAKAGGNGRVALFPQGELSDIVEIISGTKATRSVSLPRIGQFKRARAVELSGGVGLDRELYARITRACEDAVASFWKNRVTLMRMGKLYTKNLFKNLGRLALAGAGGTPAVTTVSAHAATIGRPILVLGAGEGAETLLRNIPAPLVARFFVLAVDAAAPLLKARGVVPDGIVCVESQLAIEKAHIGGVAKKSVLFADISSREEVTRHTETEVSYFATRFSDAAFFDALSRRRFFPPVIPPLGSVGLVATHLALLLRKSERVPVLVAGLDFSFPPGKTHANGTYPHIARLSSSNRLFPAENHDAAFAPGGAAITTKDGRTAFTDKALSSYAALFAHTFRGQKNLFDAGESGVSLGILRADALAAAQAAQKPDRPKGAETCAEGAATAATRKEIAEYLEGEKTALNRIKELLMFGESAARRGVPAGAELSELIAQREYLFLHFPDGHICAAEDRGFLKRVRAETDSFLKTIAHALKKARGG